MSNNETFEKFIDELCTLAESVVVALGGYLGDYSYKFQGNTFTVWEPRYDGRMPASLVFDVYDGYLDFRDIDLKIFLKAGKEEKERAIWLIMYFAYKCGLDFHASIVREPIKSFILSYKANPVEFDIGKYTEGYAAEYVKVRFIEGVECDDE